MKKFPRIDWRFTWIGLAVLALIVRYILSLNPTFTEIVYTRGVFTLFRYVYDYSLGFLPFPMLYPVLAGLLAWGGWRLWKYTRRPRRRERPLPNRIGSFLLTTLAVMAILMVAFFVLWGYNYYRVPVEHQMELELGKLDLSRLQAEIQLATREVVEARKQIPGAGDAALDEHFLPPNMECSLRQHLLAVLQQTGYPAPGRVRGRQLYPKGWLMRLGATGIYIPFVLEGHIDGGLHPISKPFTMTHELSHGYGFGDEGTANFWAYLATRNAKDPFIQYSGKLYYWLYLASQLRAFSPPAYEDLQGQLPQAIRNDIRSIRENNARYPPFFPELFDKIYDNYLKSQGIQEGVQSYNRVVELVIAWRTKRVDEGQTKRP